MSIRPIAITMGDPAGVGPEIIVKAAARLRDRLDAGTLRLLVIGHRPALDHAARALGHAPIPVAEPSPDSPALAQLSVGDEAIAAGWLDEIVDADKVAARAHEIATEAAATLRAYLDRMGAVIGAVQASGRRRDRGDPSDGGATGDRADATARTHQAVIRLLEPDRAGLRLPVEHLAVIFLGMLFGRPGTPGAAETPVETLIDVFLYGVMAVGADA